MILGIIIISIYFYNYKKMVNQNLNEVNTSKRKKGADGWLESIIKLSVTIIVVLFFVSVTYFYFSANKVQTFLTKTIQSSANKVERSVTGDEATNLNNFLDTDVFDTANTKIKVNNLDSGTEITIVDDNISDVAGEVQAMWDKLKELDQSGVKKVVATEWNSTAATPVPDILTITLK